jgi:transmembrane sensor
VEFSRWERRVILSAGESFFQVAHDPGRPFTVIANGVTVRAVGTAFNVKLVGDRVDVLVTEGRVEIDKVGGTNQPMSPHVAVLTVGERTQVAPTVGSAAPVEQVAPEAVRELLSWQARMTRFVDVPLREMIARLNRCNEIKLVLEDPALGDRKIGGMIDLSQVGAFVRLLERNGEIVAKRRSDHEIVLCRGR